MKGTFLGMKKREEQMPIAVDPVKLQPVLGMAPGVYLTIIYSVIFLIVLFLVGFLPGILQSGKLVTFSSTVHPSAVQVDGVYVGSAPVDAFISPGTHEVTFYYEDVASHSFSFEVGHPVFFTWLVPRRQTVVSESFISNSESLKRYLESMFDQVVSWSAVVDFNETYYRPPLFLQVAQTSTNLSIPNAKILLASFFSQSLNYVTSREMLQDYEQSLQTVVESNTLSYDDLGEVFTVFDSIKSLYDAEPTESFVGEHAVPLTSTPMPTVLEIPVDGISPIRGFSYPDMQGVVGRNVQERFPGVHEMGIAQNVYEFTLGAMEIPEYVWAHFVQDNPYWSKANSERLQADGMVDNNYLAGLYPTVAVKSQTPIRNISWYAAQAFVSWLSDISGKEVFLPTQKQWELVALSQIEESYQNSMTGMPHDSSPSSLFGGMWEFTQDSFVPLSRYTQIEPTWMSAQAGVVIKGGSYLNKAQEVDHATVGVLSRNECSETTGFRIAWRD